jgi:hypothetical protein
MHDYATTLAFRFRQNPIPPSGPAPGFGQHNREVFQGILGLSDPELDDLESRDIIASTPVWSRTESEKEMVRKARAALTASGSAPGSGS